MQYDAIFRKFNELDIEYIVVGGLAVNFQGVPRLTYDIDLLIYFSQKNVKKLVNQLLEWGYKPKVPVDPFDFADETIRKKWITEKNMKAFNFYNEKSPIAEIDIIIDSPVNYSQAKKDIVKVKLYDLEIPVISIPDLIKMKEFAGRKQDLMDIEHLKRIENYEKK
ncbi:MAG: nucleotidyl transferase AbiEii/AbiGii toxin family protein [bacterium]|nr:nucleotidyl transferase AbiEii/AbiGii toxin family protein [bacterium]